MTYNRESMNVDANVSENAHGQAVHRLLVIDDDAELCQLLTEYLIPEGFEVDTTQDPQQGVERALSSDYSLVILDVMMPVLNGFEVLRRIRARSIAPVLMLTARGEEVDRIVGLEIGADDYLPKPFSPRELVARIRAILRRTTTPAEVSAGTPRIPRIVVEDVELDPGARTVRCKGQPVELTGVEFNLLEALLKAAGRVIQRVELSKTVLGRRWMPYDRSIDMHVSNLRRKLGTSIAGTERIKSVRGLGYVYTLSNQTVEDMEQAE